MIVVTDLMGTLTAGAPVLGMLSWLKEHQSKFQANLFLILRWPSYGLVKLGLINYHKWGQRLFVDSLSLLKNMSPEKFDEMAEWMVEKDLWVKRREDVIARMNQHTADGAQIYIASSLHQPGVEAFAKRIGAHAIGTSVEFVNGRVQLATELVASERKIEQVRSRFGVSSIDYAYGDSWFDIPLLEQADHPVAVYPEPKLRSVAQERGWEIIEEPSK